MPSALLRPCPGDGGRCPELVASGSCPKHARQVERRRGTASSRGYDSYWSKTFRPHFITLLIAAGLAPICGAALPGGPSMAYSRCAAEGVTNGRRLHLDHEPPLTTEERSDRRKVCDPKRVGFLCVACHSAKTLAEMGRTA